YIVVAWVSLYFGAATVLFTGPQQRKYSPPRLAVDLGRLKKAILILSIIGGAGVIGQVVSIIREFGGVLQAILLNSNDIYNARTSNELSGQPYAGACSFAACALAGVHVAKSRKFTSVALFPIVLVAIQLAFEMGR